MTRMYEYPMAAIVVRGADGVLLGEIEAGHVFRLQPDWEAFGDCVALGMRQDDYGAYWVLMARPYLYAFGSEHTLSGAPYPKPLMGCEDFEVAAKSLLNRERFKCVGTRRRVR